jgi:ABC-type phosphate transport system substrate-binding protein
VHRTIWKLTAVAAGGATALIGLVGVSPTIAAAGTTNYQLNSVGSDVTYCAMKTIDKTYTKGQVASSGNAALDTPPYLSTNIGCTTTPASFTVPADSVHGAITYSSTNLPPNGSSAGITAFVNDAGKGNIAYVRSTSGRSSTNPANLEFWAYGLDAVSWDYFTTNTSAPKNLTAAQLQGIYNCTFTNWDQVGGKNAKIARYYPVTTSGTAAFFAKVFLGGSEPVSTTACPIKFVPQNDATQVAATKRATAILPYSYANYYAQTHKVNNEANLAAGTVLGKINGTAASATTISEPPAFANVSGDACTSTPVSGQFCASRYIYNITWQALPAAYYSAVINEIGVPSSGTPSAQSICSNADKGKISLYGFVPLAQAPTAQSTSSDPVPGVSYCRQF